MNSSDWIGLGGVKKKPGIKWISKGNDGSSKGYIIYFSHWNNYGINPTFQCDSPLNPLCHSEFDVLDSLGKNLTLLANKTALAIIASHRNTCLFCHWSKPVSWSASVGKATPGCRVLLFISDVTLMSVQLPCDWQRSLKSHAAGGEKAISWFSLWLMCCCNL